MRSFSGTLVVENSKMRVPLSIMVMPIKLWSICSPRVCVPLPARLIARRGPSSILRSGDETPSPRRVRPDRRRSPKIGRRRPRQRQLRMMALGVFHKTEDIRMKLTGNCFCGAVELELSGAPEAMGYCHCRSCRSWSGGPVNAFSLWKPEAVRVTRGAENIATFQKTPLSQRQYCAKCGGHLMTNHPTFGLIDVFAATIPELAFKP